MSGDAPAPRAASELAAWLRAQLARRAWSQADLARRLAVPNATVARWMRGDRVPSPVSCERLADAFGTEVDTVLALAGHRPTAEPLATDDARARYAAMLRRIRLDPDRELVLESILTAWLDADRARRD